MKVYRNISGAVLALAVFMPAKLSACAACGSANSNLPASPLTNGMNLGILTLLGVLVSVLTCAAVFFVRIVRKEEALAKTLTANKQPA